MNEHENAAAQLLEMVRGFVVTKTLFLAAKLGIADLLAAGPQSAERLAQASGADPAALYRILRALSSRRVFEEVEPGVFALGPVGTLLRSDVAGSMRAWVLTNGGPIFRAFADAEHSVRTGEAAFERALGASFFDFLADEPLEGKIFNDAMADFGRQTIAGVLATYDFSGVEHLVDVGGGQGAFVTAVLGAYPELTATVFDRPQVVAGAEQVLRQAGVLDRCRLVGGDFFEEVPAGADTYVLSWIVHDWDDARATHLLRACRRAIRPDGRLLLVEAIVPDGNEPHFAKFGDIVMLVALGGRERTRDEYASLLAAAGFELTRVVATGGPRSVIEATPDI